MNSIPIELFAIRTERRDWGTETVIAEGPGYCGKILRYARGKAGGLQLHRLRTESFHLYHGEAWVDFDAGDGHLVRRRMLAGETVHVPAGAAHRFEAITDCTVFEVSTSAAEDRVRMEAAYGLPDPGGLPTTLPEEGRTPESSGPSYYPPPPPRARRPIVPDPSREDRSGLIVNVVLTFVFGFVLTTAMLTLAERVVTNGWFR